MDTYLKQLLRDGQATQPVAPFVSAAKYYARMDMMVFLQTDVAHRSEPVDAFLTVLLHPENDEEVIGIKLKGVRHTFEEVRKRWNLTDEDFILWHEVLAVALERGLGDAIIDSVSERRRRYSQARKIAIDAGQIRIADVARATAA